MTVNCGRITDSGSTRNRKPGPLVMPPNSPLLLIRWAKTWLRLAWWDGTKISTRMIAATPMTCHHTEMLLTMASRWLEKIDSTVTTNSTPMKIRKTRPREYPSAQLELNVEMVRSMKVAAP